MLLLKLLGISSCRFILKELEIDIIIMRNLQLEVRDLIGEVGQLR